MLDDLSIDALYTHDRSGFEDHAPIPALDADKTKYADGPTLLMVRDLRDIVVSGYFQVRRRLHLQRADLMSLSDFIRDPYYGIEKAVRFNLQWFAAAAEMPQLGILRYEDLHGDTDRALAAVVRLAGRHASSEAIGDVAARWSFVHMRRLEASGGFEARYGKALVPADPADPESYKVRRGMIEGYIDYLSSDNVEYCDRIMSDTDYFSRLQSALCLRSVLGFQPCVLGCGDAYYRVQAGRFRAISRSGDRRRRCVSCCP